ncbi:MAG: tyrosine-type recombinase/integrase [Actinobacteria bacterium]|nr:tyrosine-type recombinase/integrase [Actinomycetota bacterium]
MCEDLAEHLVDHPDDQDALVFTAGGGGPLRHNDFMRYVWRRAVRAAGLPAGLTPHELRHTAAALLIAQGAGPKSIQAQLGHATIVTTFNTYGHLFEGHLDDVMERLDSRWRRARSEPAAPDDRSEPEVLD